MHNVSRESVCVRGGRARPGLTCPTVALMHQCLGGAVQPPYSELGVTEDADPTEFSGMDSIP